MTLRFGAFVGALLVFSALLKVEISFNSLIFDTDGCDQLYRIAIFTFQTQQGLFMSVMQVRYYHLHLLRR